MDELLSGAGAPLFVDEFNCPKDYESYVSAQLSAPDSINKQRSSSIRRAKSNAFCFQHIHRMPPMAFFQLGHPFVEGLNFALDRNPPSRIACADRSFRRTCYSISSLRPLVIIPSNREHLG